MPTIHESHELLGLRGPLTARQALDVILPHVLQVDPEFTLTLVGSGEGINDQGGAYEWDFFFVLSRSQRLGNYVVHLCPQEGDDEGPWCMDVYLRPLLPPSARAFKLPPAPPATVLPLNFRDSLEAVQSLAEQGADFISGDSHMTLSSKVLSNGAVVWHTTCWDKDYDTPFAPGASE